MAHLLIIRFSAIGDVAMTVPVIDSLARQYPDDCFTVVSQSSLAPLYAYCLDNVNFIGVNLKTDYKGMAGMYRLYRELSVQKIDAFADLHDVLRTKLLRILFRLSRARVRHIDKGRKEKRQLTRKKDKVLHQLKPSTERYADVFRALGKPVDVAFHSLFSTSQEIPAKIIDITGDKRGKWIGIAPFAKHQWKTYPLEKTEELIAYFTSQEDIEIFLFGGSGKEQELLENWSTKYPHVTSIAGRLLMGEELVLMSHLDVMFSMDSANMHLASLTATPVVSVWGATHPYAGFYGYGQQIENAVQIDLSCRPCSVYGNKPCYRKDTACLMDLSPQKVIDQIEKVIAGNKKTGV